MPKSLLLFIGLSKVLLSKTTNSYEEKILISEEDMEVVLLHLMVKKGKNKDIMQSDRALGLGKSLW